MNATYIGHLRSIIHDGDELQQESKRLQEMADDLMRDLKKLVTKDSAGSLIWSLGVHELMRIQQLVGQPLSDFAGHAQLLRAVAASTGFNALNFGTEPKFDECLEICGALWTTMGWGELVRDLARDPNRSSDDQRNMMACQMSLLDATQRELLFIEQAEERTTRLFGQFSRDIIEPEIGVTVDQVVGGMAALRKLMEARLNLSFERLTPMMEKYQAYKDGAVEPETAFTTEGERDRVGEQAMNGFQAMETIFTFSTADLQEALGAQAESFLNTFTFTPGDSTTEFQSPFESGIARSRPFARMKDGSYFLVDPLYCAFAPLHRLPEVFKSQKQLQRLNRRRDSDLEDGAAETIERILAPEFSSRSYYLPVGHDNSYAERDLILAGGDSLFVVESKARPLRSASKHRGNITKIQDDVKKTIQEGYDQAVTVARYLKSRDEADLYDKQGPNREVKATIDLRNIKQTHLVVVLDSYYGVIGTNLQPWLNVDDEFGYPWVIDRYSLETLSLLIDTPKKLAEFVEWRVQLHGRLVSEDELCFGGFYVRHGAMMPPFSDDTFGTLSPDYSDVFDATHFRNKGFDVDIPKGNATPSWVVSKRDGEEISLQKSGCKPEKFNIRSGVWQTGNRAKQKVREQKGKTGRNDQCPCESGRKFKKCCGHPSRQLD